MTPRSPEQQTKHDRRVFAEAEAYRTAGWSVRADHCTGYRTPEKIGGHIPDVFATGGSKETVIEVETADSKDGSDAKAQAAAFRAWQQQSPSTRTFEVKIAS